MEPEDQRISVLVADDEERLRRIVAALLSAEEDIEVVGQAADGQQAIALAHSLVPDLVLLDVRMPGLRGSTRRGRSTGCCQRARSSC